MNENKRELESNATSLKHRIGEFIFLGGVILVIIGIIPFFMKYMRFYDLALTGVEVQLTLASYYPESLIVLVGSVMIVTGLIIHVISWFSKDGLFSEDGLWILQIGPHVR